MEFSSKIVEQEYFLFLQKLAKFCILWEIKFLLGVTLIILGGNSTLADIIVTVWAISVRAQFNNAVHYGG